MERDISTTREIRHARTRDEILFAARELVVEKGVERFSLREVARRVDYSPAGLYEYFANREELLGALSGQAMAKLTAAVQGATGADCAERLLSIGLRYIEFGTSNPNDYLLLFGRMRSSRGSLETTPGSQDPYGIMLRAVIECAGEQQVRDSGQSAADAFAYGLWSLVHGQVMLRLTHLRDFDADFDQAAVVTLQAYINGIG